MSKDYAALGKRLFGNFRTENDKKIADQTYLFVQNHRPRGMANIPLVVGTTDIPLAPSLKAQMKPRIDFEFNIDVIHLAANDVCSVTFDLWVQRPGDSPAHAASIVNGHYPALVGAQEVVINPVVAPLTGPGPVWLSTNVKANSLLWLFLTAADGLTDVITFNIGARCL